MQNNAPRCLLLVLISLLLNDPIRQGIGIFASSQMGCPHDNSLLFIRSTTRRSICFNYSYLPLIAFNIDKEVYNITELVKIIEMIEWHMRSHHQGKLHPQLESLDKIRPSGHKSSTPTPQPRGKLLSSTRTLCLSDIMIGAGVQNSYSKVLWQCARTQLEERKNSVQTDSAARTQLEERKTLCTDYVEGK